MQAVRLSLAALVVVFACGLAQSAFADTRAYAFPTALKPTSINNVAASATDPVAFVPSRETDTVFAFDPRTGHGIGEVLVGDGPLAIELCEENGRRLLGVTCDGYLGTAANRVVIVDATDPSAMRVARAIDLPDGLSFLFGQKTLRFLDGGAHLIVTATDGLTSRALLLAYDAETGAELGRADVGYVPGSISVRETGGRRVVAISQSVGPHGRVTIVDATDLGALRVERIIKFPKKSSFYNVNTIALDEDATHGYVASGDANAVFTFDVATGAILSRTTVGSFPTDVSAFTIDGAPRLLVTNEASASLSIFDRSDPAHPSLLSTYGATNTAFFDVAPAITSDGHTAFIASTDQNKLFAVDLATGTLKYRASTGDRPVAAAVWEGQGTGERYACVVSSTAANVTTVRDGATGGSTSTFAGSGGAIYFTTYQNVALSGDGRFAFTASKTTNELLAFDVATATLVGRVPVSVAPSQIAVAETASGVRRVVALGSGDSVLTVVDATDPSALSVTGAVPLDSPFPFYLEYANVEVTADGTTAFVADGSQFVYSIDLATATIVGSTGAGYVPVTLALREDRGQRRLAVLGAKSGSSGVVVLDVTNPASMSIVASAPFSEDTVVALNNVPRFTADGRYVLAGASLSERIMSIDATTGRIVGSVANTNAVVTAPFSDGTTQRFAAVELGTDVGSIYRLKPTGGPKRERALASSGGGFFLVGNDPALSADGATLLVPNFGRASLLRYDAATGAFTGELPLGLGPGACAVHGDSAVAIEINGTSSRILFASLGDLRAPASATSVTPTMSPRTAAPHAANAVGVADVAAAADGIRASTYSIPHRRTLEWTPRSRRK